MPGPTIVELITFLYGLDLTIIPGVGFSKKFLEGNHQLNEIKIVYENHPQKSKRDLEELEHQLIHKIKPICNA